MNAITESRTRAHHSADNKKAASRGPAHPDDVEHGAPTTQPLPASGVMRVPENRLATAVDEQTGKPFAIEHETGFAIAAAALSGTYLIGSLVFLLWLLFGTWSGTNTILVRLGYAPAILSSGTFRLMAYVAVGGALGATVDGLRSLISWHSERQAYGPRFIWKDLSLPPVGAAVALFVYTTVRGGIGMLNGNFSLDPGTGAPVVTAFAVAAITGFSAWQVFRWLDAQANRLFSTEKLRAAGTSASEMDSSSSKKDSGKDAATSEQKLLTSELDESGQHARSGQT